MQINFRPKGRKGIFMKKEELKKQLTEWRHYLHEHPESAFEEINTAAFVAEKLREMGIETETGIGKTGVVGTLKVGDGKSIIGLRADMDCICLQEETEDLSYKSKTPNRMPAVMTDIPLHSWEQLKYCQKVKIFLELSVLYSSPRKSRDMVPKL